MSAVIFRTWSRRRAETLADALSQLGLVSPPDPRPRPDYAPPEPDHPVFYAYRERWWQRWRVHASLHWVGEYTMDFDAGKVRHVWGVGGRDGRDVRAVVEP